MKDLEVPPITQLPKEEAEPLRVRMAAERTLLAWIRTGLAMMGFGFIVARFGLFLRELASTPEPVARKSPGLSLWLGTALVALGVAVNCLAASRHYQFLRRFGLDKGEAHHAYSLGPIVAFLLAAIGVMMAIYLISFN
jgi:putative membrane protein